jgi:glycine/D-amino acid oxidase-like deaminating enzyme
MELECDVAVVGGGVLGATIAAALVDRGLRTALVERGGCAAQGASRHSGGIVRLYDPDPVLMALARHSLHCLRARPYGEEFARSLARTGVLYRAPAAQAEAVRAALAAGSDPHHPVHIGRAPDAGPWGEPRAGRLDLWEPRGAVGDVRMAVRSMANRVQRQGMLLENFPVRAIASEAPQRALLLLAHGRLRCRIAVVAAGPWTGTLLPRLGVQARTIPLVRLWARAPARMPVIDAVAGSYVVPLSGRLVQVGSGIRHAADQPEDLPVPGEAQRADALQRLAQLSGVDEPGPVLDVLDGCDAYSPDGRPLVGFVDDEQPVYVATGMCGIGFKLAPAIADIASHDIGLRLAGASAGIADPWAALRPTRMQPAHEGHAA